MVELTRGRLRAIALTDQWKRGRGAPPLKRLVDQGGTNVLTHEEVGATDPVGWPDAFLTANSDGLGRLAIEGTVRVER